MFRPKRSRADSAELEIVYEVQWKTPGNGDDKARIIGILDTLDTNLDWNTFKSYLIQSSGNMHLSTNDIKISYVDSDDDLIPVDSEMEFSECLKFSRGRARHGKKILMKVSMSSNGGARPKEPPIKVRSNNLDHKPKLFCLKNKEPAKKKTYCFSSDKETGSDVDIKNTDIPQWFENYMSNFKVELVKEITESVAGNVKALVGGTHARRSAPPDPTGKYHLHHVLEKRKKKKKISEEDSSDCTDGLQHWEEKMDFLRHMQKLSKREKKFEKKLDAKLEKLETKTKKIMEKKTLGLFGEGKLNQDVWKHRAMLNAPNVYVPTYSTAPEAVMDACGPLGECNYTPHVAKGEVVTQAWKVMNNGQLAWTDDTELRFAWGSESLVPLATSVKCPPLQPGETGKVKVKLRAPTYAGSFESYWHFHHAGRRFGHWLGVSLVVRDEDGQIEDDVGRKTQVAPVDLTVQGTRPRQQQDDALTMHHVTQAVANMTVYGVPDEWKHSEIPVDLDKGMHEDERTCDEPNSKDEYYSDSDHLSIISGTLSVDTDGTEPSEEFVVIPMPQCFGCEQPQSPLPVTQPISVEIPLTRCVAASPTAALESDNNNNMELKPFPEIPICIPMTPEVEVADPVITDDEDPNNVYVRDATGRAVPVAKVLPSADRDREQQSPPFNAATHFSHSTFGDPNIGHGPNGPRFPCGATFFYEASVLASTAPPPQCHNPGASANFRPQHDYSPPPQPKGETFCGHPCQQPPPPPSPTVPLVATAECHCQRSNASSSASVTGSSSNVGSAAASSVGGWSSARHIHTEQPRATCPKRPGAPHLERAESRREKSPVAAAVQILPETLVTGAVNVASSAINTARSVIDMLIPRHDDVVTGHWPASAPPPSSVMDDSLRTLAEMGFNDCDLNVTLLKRHDNDVARVISDLIH